MKPLKIFRNTHRGLLFGICAGIADYLEVSIVKVRLAAVLTQLVFPLTWLLYLGLIFLLPKATSVFNGRVEGGDPNQELSLRQLFRQRTTDLAALECDLQQRITTLEAFVTSDRFEMEMQIGAMKRGKRN
ncbi:MAG: PspC domain-containing protein [Gammaproteobacteria bacterium]|nr:PspC domain-containing protein [Gammaproteobacteria bacterium]